MSSQINPHRRTAADNFLYSENEKSDYDWLVTPPGSPTKSSMNQLNNLDANPMALNSTNQTNGLKGPSSSNSSRSTNRHSTPATRSTTPTSSRATSRATLTSSSTTSSRSTTLAKRPSSSGTSRATSTSARVTSTSRPSTPTRRPSSSGTSRANLTTARATTLTVQQTTGTTTSTRSNNRPMTAPNTKPVSRPTTPTRRPPTSTGSSTVLKSKPTKPAPSPTLRSRPWEPYEMPGFSLEAPPNLRTTLPERPQTASSRRTIAFGTSSSRSTSIERTVSRRQSCSPSRNRAPIKNVDRNVASPLLRGGRPKTNKDDGSLISPIAKRNQKVERVENVRKLGQGGDGGSSTAKSSSGSDGFGRNLSKSSFDMALRHMDIKGGSMKGNFRPIMTKVPVGSLYSVRSSGTRRKRPVSSSGSSESSVNVLCLDDDNLSDISYS